MCGRYLARSALSKDMPGGLNSEVLRGIHEKCTRTYEGKYSRPLFGRNVHLESNEHDQVQRLIVAAERQHERYTALPEYAAHWEKLTVSLEQMRKTYGTLGEDSRVIVDPAATGVSRQKRGDVLVLVVPPSIRQLYDWAWKIQSLKNHLHQVNVGAARDTSATPFGEAVRSLYHFVKQSDAFLPTP